jgi:hypothetical protein
LGGLPSFPAPAVVIEPLAHGIDNARRRVQAYGAAIEELEYDLAIDAAAGATFRALEVELPGGSRITALPANPDTARDLHGGQYGN